jgi:PhnB protein
MRVSPHLVFDGQCKDAFEYYRRVLGGELGMLTYGDSPAANEVDPKWHDRIVHATLKVGDFDLAGADALPQDFEKPQGFYVLLHVEGAGEAARIFGELAVGGTVRVPFGPTFWSPGFGVLLDQFGVPWEVGIAEPAAA